MDSEYNRIIYEEPEIFIDKGSMLGSNIRCFNLPNGNFGVVEFDGKLALCADGAGRNARACLECKEREKCKKPKMCPGASIICNTRCYQNNTMTLNTRRKLFKNFLASKNSNFSVLMEDALNNQVLKKGIHYFRIHSLGEFYDREYFEKWVHIAELMPGIQFTAYTKCFHMLDDFYRRKKQVPDNMKFMLSIMPDSLYGTMFEYGGNEKQLLEKKEKNKELIRRITENYNAEIYLTTYTDNFEHLLRNGEEKEFPGWALKCCSLHRHEVCSKCLDIGEAGYCYEIWENPRIIIEPIRATSGKADYRSDLKRIMEYNKKMAGLVERDISLTNIERNK